MSQQWCVVTGGAGFVGGRLVRALNEAGHDRIVVVDSFTRRPDKLAGTLGARFADFRDYFALDALDVDALDRQLPPLDVIFHVGAWTDVLETDVTKMLRYNFEHARKWIELGQRRGVPVIYASTSALYGNSRLCRVNDPTCEQPFNAYGHSKLMLDRWVLANVQRFTARTVGFRFFNVFGPGEEHKAHNASIPKRFFEFVKEQGRIELFDGDIRRDYVFVDDVARIMIEAWQARQASGVYNLGSGVVISHREIAAKVVVTAREAGVRLDREPIRTVPIPPALHGRFQFYTQAVGLLPWVADITAHPLEKMSHYWSEMLKPGDQPDAAPGEAR
jgi:ADP-L-glycero-D-manno-heptose 6-epimerase